MGLFFAQVHRTSRIEAVEIETQQQRRVAQRVPNITGLPSIGNLYGRTNGRKTSRIARLREKSNLQTKKVYNFITFFTEKQVPLRENLSIESIFAAAAQQHRSRSPRKPRINRDTYRPIPQFLQAQMFRSSRKSNPKHKKVSKKMLGMLNTQSEQTFARTHVRQKRTYVRLLMRPSHNLGNPRKGLHLSHPSCMM